MESLHCREMLDSNFLNIGFCWEIATGIYCVNLEGEGVAVRGCGTIFCRVIVPQEVTLPRLKFEQAAICPDGPSPATGEGNGVGADAATGYL